MNMTDKKPELKCPDCPFKTRSESVFVRHMEREHAARPHQIARITQKQQKESIMNHPPYEMHSTVKTLSQQHNESLPTPSMPCTAGSMTFGGKCLNCGGVNGHAKQPKKAGA